MYGDRCNFIHKKEFEMEKNDPIDSIDWGFMEVKSGLRSESRLLAILQ
jgi:hypothetical protein